MHKSLIALAIAGLAAAPAFADSNVTIYGVADYGFGIRNGDSGLKGTAAQPKQEFISGVSVPNKLGFKGSEDLGNGTKAIFELEAGYDLNTGYSSIGSGSCNFASPTLPTAKCNYSDASNGGLFRRHSWVGLTGDWGTLLGGRVDGARYGVLGKYDPFENGTVANAGSLQVHAQRADNAIAYVTPNFNGLYAVLAYTGQLTGTTNADNQGDTRLWVIQPNYVMGPLSATLDYERITVHNTPVTVNIYVAGASYDFGVAKITAYYEKVKTGGTNCENAVFAAPLGNALCDQRSWLIGGSVPITENDKIRASYVDYKDSSATQDSCRKWGIGGLHYFSKRTNLYLDYAQINQRDKGYCTINYTPTKAGSNGDGSNGTGVGTRGYDLGITHRF
jgi:predicted porin